MDFLNDKAEGAMVRKMTTIAHFFSGLADYVRQIATAQETEDEQTAWGMLAVAILAHALRLFDGLPDPSELTTGECYDLLFRASEVSVPFVVELEQVMATGGHFITEQDGRRPSEVLRDCITA